MKGYMACFKDDVPWSVANQGADAGIQDRIRLPVLNGGLESCSYSHT